MKMKLLIPLLFFSFTLSTTFGQGPPEQPDEHAKFESNKIAFITTQLDLMPSEAEKFWPLYNKMQSERKAIRQNHKMGNPRKKISEMTDEEVVKLIDNGLKMQQQELDLKKQYHEQFKTILPIKKVARLYHAEMQFKKMKKEHRPGLNGNPPHGPGPMRED